MWGETSNEIKENVMRRFILFCLIMLSFLLCGCGVSKSDYVDLEKRVRELEKLHGIGEKQPSIQDTVTSAIKSNYGDSQNEVYDLSNMSPDDILKELKRLFNPKMVNKKPSEFVETVQWRATPQTNAPFFTEMNECVVTFYNGVDIIQDRITKIIYSYEKNMDGSFSKLKSMSINFIISDYEKASDLYEVIKEDMFLYGMEDKSNMLWRIRKDYGDLHNEMQMSGISENSFMFSIYRQFSN